MRQPGLEHAASVDPDPRSAGDGRHLQRPADPAGLHHLERERVGEPPPHRVERVHRVEDALVGHQRNVDSVRDSRHGVAFARLHGLLHEGWPELLELAHAPDCVMGFEALVVVDPQVQIVAVDLAQPAEAHQIKGMLGEAGLDLEDPHPVGPELRDVLEVLPKIRIRDREAQPHPVAHPAAEKIAHRQPGRLPGDVEQRHLHRRLGLGMPGERPVDGVPVALDQKRILALEQRADVAVQRGGASLERRAREGGPGRGFAPAGQAGVGGDLENRHGDAGDVADAVRVDRPGRDAHLMHAHALDSVVAHGISHAARRLIRGRCACCRAGRSRVPGMR